MRGQDQHSRLLCVLAHSILRSPGTAAPSRPPAGRPLRASPAGFVSMLLGVSTALLVSGSMAFAIGIVLMPWVIGMAMVLYVLGVVSDLSLLGKTILRSGSRVADLAAGGCAGDCEIASCPGICQAQCDLGLGSRLAQNRLGTSQFQMDSN